jgi:hypothetical protein
MVTCAGCPYGTFGQRTGIQRSSALTLYAMIETAVKSPSSPPTRTAALPEGTPPSAVLRRGPDTMAPFAIGSALEDIGGSSPRETTAYATGASSSKKPRVLFGSTGMPGPMVVVKVIFFR